MPDLADGTMHDSGTSTPTDLLNANIEISGFYFILFLALGRTPVTSPDFVDSIPW